MPFLTKTTGKILTAILLFSLYTSAARAEETFKVAFFNFPPHVTANGIHPQGAAVEFFETVIQEMGGKKLIYREYPLNRVLMKLESGEADIGLYFAKTPERAQSFVYPQRNFDTIPLAIAVRHDHPLKEVKEISDLYGLKIGYAEGAYLSSALRDRNLNLEFIQGRDWVHQNMSKVERKRIDAALSGYYQLLHEISLPKFKDKFRIMRIPHTGVSIYTVFSKRVPAKTIQSYEKALDSVLNKTSYKEIFMKHLGR